jgi:hypothetical protein
MAINWMSTGNYLVVHYGSNRPCVLEKNTEKYDTILKLLLDKADDQEIINALDIGSKIELFSEGTFNVDRDTGVVAIDNQEVHGVISERIVSFCKNNLPYLPLVNFWRNIQENPSQQSREHLYLFLEANKMPITHDGCFMAYKKVRRDQEGNLVDCHSGKFCNNVGAVVTMDRSQVNPDRRQTCSQGLHVAAFEYAEHNYDGTDLLEVKVNPKDVVAVPDDYANQKMRVCRYEVVGINTKRAPVAKEYLDKTEVRAKRKLGEKQVKSLKSEAKAAKAQKLEEHKALIDSLKDTAAGGEVLLSGLTANEIVEVTQALTGQNIMVGLKDMKNKKGIVKRAQVALKDHGYEVLV